MLVLEIKIDAPLLFLALTALRGVKEKQQDRGLGGVGVFIIPWSFFSFKVPHNCVLVEVPVNMEYTVHLR